MAPALRHAEPQQTVLGSTVASGHAGEEPAVPALSALCVPVFSRGQLIGTLTAVAAGPRIFSRRETERLAHVAALSAFCLHSAWLAEEQLPQRRMRLPQPCARRCTASSPPRPVYSRFLKKKQPHHSTLAVIPCTPGATGAEQIVYAAKHVPIAVPVPSSRPARSVGACGEACG